MQLLQDIGELRTHGKVSGKVKPEDLPKALEYYGARIGRDLGTLHELTEGKITIGYIVEMASIYENLCNTDIDNVPSLTPAQIFAEDVIPAMKGELTVEAIEDDIDTKSTDD